MDEIHIPNDATYSPVSLTDVIATAPLASRLLLGATLPGRVLSAAALGASLEGTQDDYNRTQNGLEMRELRDEGENLALATNVLIGVGATTALVSLYLFLSE